MNFRSFIAVPIHATPAIQAALAELGKMGRRLKLVEPDNLHITVKFLGETAPHQEGPIVNVLDRMVGRFSAEEFHFRGLGVFSDQTRPTVCWAGIANTDPIQGWHRFIENELRDLGFTPDRYSYRPHLTLARIRGRPPRQFSSVLERYAANDFGSRKATEITWFRSDLTPNGPRYRVLHRAKLRGAG
ncbi:RNA 2',3'-cyclic phosphodiesterase [Stratiformator vulcanicus]|uniref:RNA 2',3'-cyclic phosphodiesterase n=1 Tax=Stratiformator vulcanicus TaxID=2527980 RepID=A0A517R6L3_9PLAN|nr:RNA 2',3'-cyclic phosphodiesterase [Stratiformator vulcanicus]QDT39518.1 2',5' RNA ligase family [Stratiformator vulcanicus]